LLTDVLTDSPVRTTDLPEPGATKIALPDNPSSVMKHPG